MNNQNSRAYEFLNLYKTLEEILTNKYSRSKRKFSSSVIQFMNDDEGKKYREELNLFREIRNLLSHHPELDGENAVEPSQSVIDALNEIIYAVENPPMAMSIATITQNLVKATLSSSVLELTKLMDEKGFSHIPIMNGQILYGVFSVSTMFSYFGKYGREKIEQDTKIDQFKELLPIDIHSTEAFRFMSSKATYYDLKDAFSLSAQKKKRLAAIFITESGAKDKPLMGMITPWDLIRNS